MKKTINLKKHQFYYNNKFSFYYNKSKQCQMLATTIKIKAIQKMDLILLLQIKTSREKKKNKMGREKIKKIHKMKILS